MALAANSLDAFDQKLRWYPVISDLALPPRSFVEVGDYDQEEEAYIVAYCQGDAPRAMLITDASPIPPGTVGAATPDLPAIAGYVQSQQPPESGQIWGVEQGKPYLSRFRPGFQVLAVVGPATVIVDRQPGTYTAEVMVKVDSPDGPEGEPIYSASEIFPLAFDLTNGLQWTKESDAWAISPNNLPLGKGIYSATYAGHHAGRRLFVVFDCSCPPPGPPPTILSTAGDEDA